MLIESTERTNARQVITPAGRVRSVSDAVICAPGASWRGAGLHCPVLLLHAGLLPGDYPLTDGGQVTITEEMVGDTPRVIHGITLKGTAP